MNGPKPVRMSATKKVNQSSPRRLAREGFVGRSSVFELGCLVDTGTAALSGARRAGLGLRHLGRGAQDHNWLAVFVLGSSLHLGSCKLHHDAVRLFSRSETQDAPVDGNLPASDSEESAEI